MNNTLETGEVSIHEIWVFNAFRRNPGRWMTNKEIRAEIAESLSDRTVRAKTVKLVRMGLLDQAEVFPSHRYRLADKASKRNGGYFARLEEAAKVFGVHVKTPA